MAKKEKEKKESKSIEVDKEVLDQIIKKQEEMQKSMEEKDLAMEDQKKTIQKLESISDKGRSKRWDEENSTDELVKVIRIPFYKTPKGRKLVVGWESGTDEVGYSRDGKPFFNQTVILHIEEDDDEIKKEEIDYSLFYRNIETEPAEVLNEKEKKNQNGTTLSYEVKLDSGREIEIDSKFINPF